MTYPRIDIVPSPLLMVSNNPEHVCPATCTPGDLNTGALWWHKPDLPALVHRVFFWHTNFLKSDAYQISLTIENLGCEPIVISDIYAASGTGENAGLQLGYDIAACYLANTLPKIVSTTTTVYVGTVVTLFTWPWAQKCLTGAQVEVRFASVPGPYRLRMVYHDSTPPNTIVNNLPPPPHHRAGSPRMAPRGGWQFSEVRCHCNYSIPATGATEQLFEIYQQRDATQFTFAQENSSNADQEMCYDEIHPRPPCPVRNEGPWGAIVHIRLQVTNGCAAPQLLGIRVNARGGNGPTAGAIKLDGEHVVNITHKFYAYDFCPVDSILAPPGCTRWDYSWALAGASECPIAIRVGPNEAGDGPKTAYIPPDCGG